MRMFRLTAPLAALLPDVCHPSQQPHFSWADGQFAGANRAGQWQAFVRVRR